MTSEDPAPRDIDGPDSDRRDFITKASSLAMAGGLVAGYGTFAAFGVRFLYPVDQQNVALQFVATLVEFKIGDSMEYTAPSGATIVIARYGREDEAESFVALSSVCPHLGCQVHWEEPKDRFFCPCHNGAFDREGVATEGPPALAKQNLKRYPLKVLNGLLFIEAPVATVGQAVARGERTNNPSRPPTQEA